MKKEWFFDRYCGQQFAALMEDGNLTEFSVESETSGEIVGNVYKGRVTNVLSGMNAVFISCGLAKNCYLSMEETYTDYTKYDGTFVQSSVKPLNLKVGDEIIVQVTQAPRGNKGAKVTTHISFVGNHLIYLPGTDFLGISRKITDEKQREKLLKIADKMRMGQTDDGFIVRTQAPFATQKQLKTEAEYLKKLYNRMQETAKNAPVGAVLYEDEELPIRCMRDSFGGEIVAIHVGDEDLYKRLLSLIRLRGDIPERKLVKYMGARSMMQEYGITPLIYDALRPTVPLKNGGYLVIEHTEAMTVVDVNTGSYTGETNLEETVFAVNLSAADFIDMTDEAHRLAVNEKLETLLAKDKAKCKILPMSELCLTQFTRKRVGREVLSYLVKPCPHCEGKSYVHEDIFVVSRIREAILDCFAKGYTAVIIELNDSIMRKILSERLFEKELSTRWKNLRVYMVPHRTYKEERFTVRGDDGLPNE